jgi:hypothetical protein
MDKREAVRVPVRVRAQCRANQLVIDGTVEDLSRSGAFFTAPAITRELDTGSSTEIKLDLPGEPTLHLVAEVVRVVRVDHQPHVGMALKFIGEVEGSRRPLANFIMRCHAFH